MSRPSRITALCAAYALALHALFVSFAPVSSAAIASASMGAICISTSTGDEGGSTQWPCTADCVMPGCGADGWTPPVTQAVTARNPVAIQTVHPIAIQIIERVALQTPQIPRAPPVG